MSRQIQTARSCARRTVSRGRPSGFTLIELLVVISIIGMLMALLLPQISAAREKARGNTCRNNMRGVATALYDYMLNKHFPGYMNALQLQNGDVYRDPQTNTITPVSWAVMILPGINRGQLFDQWRKPTAEVAGSTFINTKVYIDQFLCPSDAQSNKTGTPISFVVNSGQPDAASAVVSSTAGAGIPRDWASSGLFFDHFSEHTLVKTTTTARGRMEYVNDANIRDQIGRTIMLTENVDAANWTFDPNTTGSSWQSAEIEVGCIWSILAGSVSTTSTPPQVKPNLPSNAASIGGGGGGGGGGGSSGGGSGGSASSDPNDKLRINNGTGRGDSTYYYCRPSSNHPQSVNVAYGDAGVAPLSDGITYFVYVKLMTSDDEGVKQVGVNQAFPDQPLKYYQLTESDLNP